jgi:hypothetical protein
MQGLQALDAMTLTMRLQGLFQLSNRLLRQAAVMPLSLKAQQIIQRLGQFADLESSHACIMHEVRTQLFCLRYKPLLPWHFNISAQRTPTFGFQDLEGLGLTCLLLNPLLPRTPSSRDIGQQLRQLQKIDHESSSHVDDSRGCTPPECQYYRIPKNELAKDPQIDWYLVVGHWRFLGLQGALRSGKFDVLALMLFLRFSDLY